MSALRFVAAAVLCVSSVGCASATTFPQVATPVAIDGDRPLAVRTDAGSLWVGAHAWSETRRTWDKPARGQIEQLSIRRTEGGHEITFVQGGLTWRGAVDADHRAQGPLEMVPATSARSSWGVGSVATMGASAASFARVP